MLSGNAAAEIFRRGVAPTLGDFRRRYEELEHFKDSITYPCVVKISGGAGSRGVVLVHNQAQLKKTAKSLTRHIYSDEGVRGLYNQISTSVKRYIKQILHLDRQLIKPHSPRSNKIVIEQFVQGLSGDNKVLYFNGKYFVLSRSNRQGDFRASGSGKFTYPQSVEQTIDVLQLAQRAAAELKTPLLSLDIGKNDSGCYLLEYQAVSFGPYTLQYAPHCFVFENGEWQMRQGSFDLEQEYAEAISDWIQR